MKNLILLVMAVMLFVITGCSTLCKENSVCGKTKKGNTLKIGWASTDISTTEPVLIQGQFHARISKGIHDPITATALWIDNGKESVCFVSADLASAGGGLLDDLTSSVKKQNPAIPAGSLLFNATHTHAAPVTSKAASVLPLAGHKGNLYRTPSRLKVTKSEIYRAFLIKKLTHIICKAYENRKEGGFAYGYGYAPVGYNRRSVYKDDVSKRKGVKQDSLHGVHGHAKLYGSTKDDMFYGFEGGADPKVNFLFTFDKNKNLTGSIINIACPSQNSSRLEKLSADYWHETREMIRKKYGNIFILPQCSAAGDTAPVLLLGKGARSRRYLLKYGRNREYIQDELARIQAAEKIFSAFDEVYAWAKNEIFFQADVQHERKTLELPRREVTKADYESAVKELEALKKVPFMKDDRDPAKALWTNSRLVSTRNRYKRIISRYETQKKIPFKTTMDIVHIGNIAFAGNPFELYQDYMHRIQGRSPFMQTFIVQLAGAQGTEPCGYLATKRSVENKGYGSDRFSNYVSWKGGDKLVEETVKTLEELWKKRFPATFPARKKTGKIVIDGSLEEEDWNNAEEVDSFMTFAGNAPSGKTSVKVMYDSDFIYIGIKAGTDHIEKGYVFKEKAVKHDGAVWEDDGFEIMLGKYSRKVKAMTHNHYVLNTAGVLYDGKAGTKFDRKFTSKIQYKVKKYPSFYVMEMKIPASDFNKKKFTGKEVLKLNIVRSCHYIQKEIISIDGIRNHDYKNFRILPLNGKKK